MNEKLWGFSILEAKNSARFGGSLLKSHPKVKRPISTHKPMHLVIRSTQARGAHSFLRRSKRIDAILSSQSRMSGVKVLRRANAGNHLHLVILPRSRSSYLSFIRAITGLIARLTLSEIAGERRNISFWDKRPFTRFVEWGVDLDNVFNYLKLNTLEALGFFDYGRIPRYTSTRQLLLSINTS
jgi:hypothetical protein